MAAYRAPTLFQPHRARQAIRDAHDGKIPPLIGLYLGLSTVPTARFVAPMNFDVVWVDWEHSACGVETMTTIQMVHEIMFMSEGRSIPFVRVPGHDHAAIGYALDAGASLVIPQVDTVEQARSVVSYAKYGTKSKGTRSAPPFRLIPGLTDGSVDASRSLHQNLNEQAAIIVQIETLEGVNNLDAILTEVPDIDAVWIGTLDLRVSMNLPAQMGQGVEPDFLAAKAKAEAVIQKHNKPYAGLALGPPEVAVPMAQGKSFIVVAAEVMAMAGMAGDLAQAKHSFQARTQLPVVANGPARTKLSVGVNGSAKY
ncbi:MAG: hypothetical protein M1838_001816 [Thelocarpon superellum]|nr:MAG: hypothetical protein M1838_001816 [Thelocarpon superellum]